MSSFLANRVASQRLLRLAEIGLAVALVLALADLIRQGVPERQDAGEPALGATGTRAGPASQAQAAAPGRPSPALLSLFGAEPALAEGPDFVGDALPETRLDLTLKGIIARRNSDQKLALIAQGGGKEEVYWLGDRVAGAEIVGIGARRVVLLRDNIRETLTLEEAKLRKDGGDRRRPAPRVAGAPRPQEQAKVDASNWGVAQLSEYQRVVARATLDQHLGSLPSLLRQAKAVPYLSNGEPAGFRVVGIDKDSVFEDLGLRQEDVIVAVNGVSVRNIQEALAAYRSFRSATAVRLDLLRGGREVSLDFSIQ